MTGGKVEYDGIFDPNYRQWLKTDYRRIKRKIDQQTWNKIHWPTDLTQDVRYKLINFALAHGFTAKDLADKLEISVRKVRNQLCGDDILRISDIAEYAWAMGADPKIIIWDSREDQESDSMGGVHA